MPKPRPAPTEYTILPGSCIKNHAAAGIKERRQAASRNAFAAVGNQERQSDHVIAIGSSAGGIEALNDFEKPAPTIPGILQQHIPPVFSRMFAERMDRETALNAVDKPANLYCGS